MAPAGVLEQLTVEQARARRAAILAEQGVTADELRELGAAYRLDAVGVAALSELDLLDYLLDDAPAV